MKKKKVLLTSALIICLAATGVYAEINNKTITAYYEHIKIAVNGENAELTDEQGDIIEPFIADDSVFLPVRGISQVLGKNVAWDGDTKTVNITDTDSAGHYDNLSFLGDSITVGVQCDGATYADLLKVRMKSKKMNNNSISGSTLAGDETNENAFVNRYTHIDSGSDFIMVMGGTNDANKGIEIGDITSTATDTVYGALKEIAFGLKVNHPDATIVFCSMIKEENRDTARYENIVTAMKQVCDIYGFPFLDLYHAEECDLTSSGYNYIVDGLHPNAKGHEVMAEYIYSQLVNRGIIINERN